MDIREQIGKRITKARKALGITIKELSGRIGTLSPARISNWEQGTRSPGPVEAKLLAEQLNVSASYLLCLTDNLQGELVQTAESALRYVPIVPVSDSLNLATHDSTMAEKTTIVDDLNPAVSSSVLFAVTVEDNSMQPYLNPGDIAIVDGECAAKPGDYVLAYLSTKKQVVLRQYREADSCLFQLVATNDLWAAITIKTKAQAKLMGVVVEIRKYNIS